MSKTLNLQAETRKRTGSGSLKQMRREGYIPSVVYGGEGDNLNIKVPTKIFTDLLAHSASASILVNLDIDGNKSLAFVQDLQTNPLTGEIIHADFRQVNNDTAITAHLPIHFVGEAIGKQRGGALEQLIHNLEISCLPKDLPEIIEVDVTTLDVGNSIHVSEVVLPSGVTTPVAGEVLVATVIQTRISKSESASA